MALCFGGSSNATDPGAHHPNTAIPPAVVAALAARRRSDALAPAATGAAFGAATGLGATVFVDLWCPVAYVPHLLLGHLLPVAVLSAAGAVGGALLLSMRR